MKKQTDIVKGQYNFFKDQMNVNKSNRKIVIRTEDGVNAENDIKTEDNKMWDVGYFYIGKEYKNLIKIIFNEVLLDSDLYLKNFNSKKAVLTNIVDKNLAEKNKYLDRINFIKSIKNLANMKIKQI